MLTKTVFIVFDRLCLLYLFITLVLIYMVAYEWAMTMLNVKKVAPTVSTGKLPEEKNTEN